MLGTILMADLVERATANGGKVILVGDPKQLPPIEAGGLFASLANRIPIVELVENRRQRDPEERFIANALRKGLTELAVRRLDRHGRVTIAHNSDVLRDQMTLDWFELHTSGRDAVMGAVHRSDVADLNERAHALLEAGGELGPLVAIVDERRYCVGDRVLGLDNRYDLGILNGDLGCIVGANSSSIVVQLDVGRSCRSSDRLRDRLSPARILPHRPQDAGAHLRDRHAARRRRPLRRARLHGPHAVERRRTASTPSSRTRTSRIGTSTWSTSCERSIAASRRPRPSTTSTHRSCHDGWADRSSTRRR